MKKPHIVLVDDQPEVVASLMGDLKIFGEYFVMDDCASSDEAWSVMEAADAVGELTAIILADHMMPGGTGVELLTRMAEDERFSEVKKVLVTGQASHEDTIEAINNATIDRYIAKPWNTDELHSVLKKLITEWVIHSGLDYKEFNNVIDAESLFRLIKNQELRSCE